jgi:hypothetical protein
MKTFKEVKAETKAVGMSVRKTPDGEFRVNFPNGAESTAYYTADAQDAINTARAMKGVTVFDMRVEIFDGKELDACEAFADAHPNGHVVDSRDDQYIYVHANQPISLAQAQRWIALYQRAIEFMALVESIFSR